MKKKSKENKKLVGILGYGEIGKAIAKTCKVAGFKVLVRELAYDQLNGKKVDYLHVNFPERDNNQFIKIVTKNIKELAPSLTVINSSVTPGTSKQIYKKTKSPIVHSPVIGLHPFLYDSIKFHFPKIIGPVNKISEVLARKHFRELGLKIEVYKGSNESEAAKLLDLVYYAWNIIFCKWVDEVSRKHGLNFDDVYTKHNQIYNQGYSKLLPKVVRPIFVPRKGPIGGHCTIPDTTLFHKFSESRFTKFILDENVRYTREKVDAEAERKAFVRLRTKLLGGKGYGK